MDDRTGKTYRPWEPHRYAHEAHTPAAKLPEGDLVFFLLDTVPQLDLSRFYSYYEDETRGAPPFDPAEMVCLLLYSYSVGVFSRAIASDSTRIIGGRLILSRDRAYDSLRNGQVTSFTEQNYAYAVPGNQEALSQPQGSAAAAPAPAPPAGHRGHCCVCRHGRRRQLGRDCRLRLGRTCGPLACVSRNARSTVRPRARCVTSLVLV